MAAQLQSYIKHNIMRGYTSKSFVTPDSTNPFTPGKSPHLAMVQTAAVQKY
jgi:hypothetical protein